MTTFKLSNVQTFKLILLFTFTFLLHLSASAAVPLRWTVETSRAQPATFEAYQGETLDFEATLQSYGKPLEAPVQYAFYWQTNGMGNAWWSVPVQGSSSSAGTGTSHSNCMHATWLPSYDVGAKAYNCFIGLSNSIYHAAFQLRLRPSPGAVPNELPLPQKVIDFSQVTVLNPPWSGGGGSGGVDTNAVIDIANATIATNATISGKRDKTDEACYKEVPVFSEWEYHDNVKDFGPDPSDWLEGHRYWIFGDVDWTEYEEYIYDDDWTFETYYRDSIDEEWMIGVGGNHITTNKYALRLDFVYNGLNCGYATRTQTGTSAEKDLSHRLARRAATAASALAKFDAAGNLVADDSGKGLSQNDYTNDEKAEVAKVKDKADEFTAWEFSGEVESGHSYEVKEAPIDETYCEFILERDGDWFDALDGQRRDSLTVNFNDIAHITATRKRVLRTGDAATPQELAESISTNNPAFVSAVQSISPPSSPTLRLYDEVRGCWWIGRMVNGIISWEVED